MYYIFHISLKKRGGAFLVMCNFFLTLALCDLHFLSPQPLPPTTAPLPHSISFPSALQPTHPVLQDQGSERSHYSQRLRFSFLKSPFPMRVTRRC